MATNYKSSPGTAGATRQGQVANTQDGGNDTDWAGGVNLASCQPGVGINTGDYDPKLSDWETSDWNGVNAAPYNGLSQFLGGIDPDESTDADTGNGTEGQTNQVVLSDPEVVANDGFTFLVSDGVIADGAAINAGVANVINRTGKSVPDATYVWGSLETP